MKHLDQYLKERGNRWHYVRRVPTHLRTLDPRGTVRASLKTSSIEVARARRDAMAEADDQFWAGLLAQVSDNDTAPSLTTVTRNRYASARKRAMARGFMYRPADSLIEDASTNELIARLEHVASNGRFQEIEAEAILGTATQAAPLVSEALQIYFERIAIGTLKNKSESQKKNGLPDLTGPTVMLGSTVGL